MASTLSNGTWVRFLNAKTPVSPSLRFWETCQSKIIDKTVALYVRWEPKRPRNDKNAVKWANLSFLFPKTVHSNAKKFYYTE